MADLIDRQAVFEAIWNLDAEIRPSAMAEILNKLDNVPSAKPESLTDKEQRIFLAAMGREEKICKKVDDEYGDFREPYKDSLVRICHEIIRKVKGALWI